jgi:hypothetical protein
MPPSPETLTLTLRAILTLTKARYDRAAAASRAASTGTALTASIEQIRELQYAMGRGEEAFATFREVQVLCRKAGVE